MIPTTAIQGDTLTNIDKSKRNSKECSNNLQEGRKKQKQKQKQKGKNKMANLSPSIPIILLNVKGINISINRE